LHSQGGDENELAHGGTEAGKEGVGWLLARSIWSLPPYVLALGTKRKRRARKAMKVLRSRVRVGVVVRYWFHTYAATSGRDDFDVKPLEVWGLAVALDGET
jgi:hypothetical protein